MAVLRSAVIGCGGAGRNALRTMDPGKSALYLMNDSEDRAFRSVFSTKEEMMAAITSSPDVHRPLTETEKSALRVLEHHDLVFSVSGMGGFYGTVAPVLLSSLSSRMIPMVSMPFSMEGEARRIQAQKGLRRLMKTAPWVLVLDNDGILRIAPNATMSGAFGAVTRVFRETIYWMSEFFVPEDVDGVLRALKGRVGVGLGEGSGMESAEKAFRDAYGSPWMSPEGRKILLMKGGNEDDLAVVESLIEKKGGEPVISSHMAGGNRIELLIIG
jgi:cell division protein FtsZ